MFVISTWALVLAVLDGWIWQTPGTHPAVPVVSLILILLSLMMAAETITAIARNRKNREI